MQRVVPGHAPRAAALHHPSQATLWRPSSGSHSLGSRCVRISIQVKKKKKKKKYRAEVGSPRPLTRFVGTAAGSWRVTCFRMKAGALAGFCAGESRLVSLDPRLRLAACQWCGYLIHGLCAAAQRQQTNTTAILNILIPKAIPRLQGVVFGFSPILLQGSCNMTPT